MTWEVGHSTTKISDVLTCALPVLLWYFRVSLCAVTEGDPKVLKGPDLTPCIWRTAADSVIEMLP